MSTKYNSNTKNNMEYCTICCDSNTTTYKILCKCGGDICISCINEVIEIKDTENNSIKDKYRLNYTCPFCKSDNSNIFNHIKLLKNKEFNEMLSKKIHYYNEKYRNNMSDQIDDYEETIDELETNIQQLEDVRTKDRLYLSYVEEQSVYSQSMLSECNKKLQKLEDVNKSQTNLIKELENKLSIYNKLDNIIIKSDNHDKYHCNICNKTINKKSKYNHNKTKKHIQLSNNNI